MFTGIIVSFLIQLFGPNPAIIVSKDTTVITSPLRADGLPDYQKYWRELGREGVTFENNAAVPFWQAIWPGDLQPQHWQPMAEALGFDRVPSPSNSLQDPSGKMVRELLGFWLTNQYQAGLLPEEADKLLSADNQTLIANEAADQIVSRAMNRPWQKGDVPPLADWVVRNEQPLELLHEATTRSKWWSPSPSLLGDNYDGAIAILLPGVQSLRTAARALTVRAMWHAGEGRPDEAWDDIKASMQLARFSGEGFTLVEQLVAIAIDGVALRATATLLQHGEPNATFAREVLDYLNARELPCDVVKSFDKGERVFFADTVVMIMAGSYSAKDLGIGELGPALDAVKSVTVNWNHVLREGNRWYDRLIEATSKPTRDERKVAYKQFDVDLSLVGRSVITPGKLFASAFSSEARSAIASDIIISLMLPALDAATKAEDRAQALLDLTRTAAALAVYRAEQGECPAALDQLVPSVLPEVPLDLYTGKPFHYERMPDGGYLLYSLYENGTDDGGTDVGGELLAGEWVAERNPSIGPGTSDLVIRVPVPKFELPPKPQFLK
jgi:hypothetical protein